MCLQPRDYHTKSGLVAGGKESKEGRQTVFFTPLDPFGSDTHEDEGPSEDYSKPRKFIAAVVISATMSRLL